MYSEKAMTERVRFGKQTERGIAVESPLCETDRKTTPELWRRAKSLSVAVPRVKGNEVKVQGGTVYQSMHP